DAYMRDYELAVPSDCVISNTVKENKEALQLMKRYLKADIRLSQGITFGERRRLRYSPWKSRPSLAPRLDGGSPYQSVFTKISLKGGCSAWTVWAVVCLIGAWAGGDDVG